MRAMLCQTYCQLAELTRNEDLSERARRSLRAALRELDHELERFPRPVVLSGGVGEPSGWEELEPTGTWDR